MGIKRHYNKAVWEDRYEPADFIAHAHYIAKDYCKAHSEADRKTANEAAQNAACIYEYNESYRAKYRFALFVTVAIKTALYAAGRENDQMAVLTNEQIEEFEADVIGGELTYDRLSEKYGISRATVAERIKKMKAEGKMPEKRRQTRTGEKECGTTAAAPCVTVVPAAAPMPDALNFIAAALMLQEFAAQLHPGAEITETYASSTSRSSSVNFSVGGEEYALNLRRTGG